MSSTHKSRFIRRPFRALAQPFTFFGEYAMNLSIIGHHLDVTPAIREYIHSKMARVLRHFDHVIDIQVMLSIEPLKHRAEITLHVRGKDIHCEASEANLYASLDLLIDKIDRKIIQHKDRTQNHHHLAAKRQLFEAA
jgi:putative sigma-54 modulation protein